MTRYSFTNGYSGDIFKWEGDSWSDAWVALAFEKETEVEDLLVRGWKPEAHEKPEPLFTHPRSPEWS